MARPWWTRGWQLRPGQHAPHEFGRLGMLVDGVYAIAATLLVLEIRLPEDVEPGQLSTVLGSLDHSYTAYVIGFLQMVAGWLQTRRLDSWLHAVDHYGTLLVLGSLGLYAMTSFTTAALARAFGNADDVGSATRLMSGLLLGATALWAVLLVYCGRTGMFRDGVDPDAFTLYYRLSVIAPVVPAVAWVVAPAVPYVALSGVVGLFVPALLPLEAHPAPHRHEA